jgi:hypothetical protein
MLNTTIIIYTHVNNLVHGYSIMCAIIRTPQAKQVGSREWGRGRGELKYQIIAPFLSKRSTWDYQLSHRNVSDIDAMLALV